MALGASPFLLLVSGFSTNGIWFWLGLAVAAVTVILGLQALSAHVAGEEADATARWSHPSDIDLELVESWWPRVWRIVAGAVGAVALTLAGFPLGVLLFAGMAGSLVVMPRARMWIDDDGIVVAGRWADQTYDWDRVAEVRLDRSLPLMFRHLVVVTDDGVEHTIFGIGAPALGTPEPAKRFVEAASQKVAGTPHAPEPERRWVMWSLAGAILTIVVLMFVVSALAA
jgi:hypothetical protein